MIINCKARFESDGNEELEKLGIETEEKFEYDDFAFLLSEVIAINNSTKGAATIWFKNTSIGTNIEYNSMLEFWYDYRNKAPIMSTLEFIEIDKLLD